LSIAVIEPDWPAHARVRALSTTREGGVSNGAYASLNLATHCGDDAISVSENRVRLAAQCGTPPVCWMNQVHGIDIVDADLDHAAPPVADAALSLTTRRACAILTADCVPVLICDRDGTMVAAAHCGWRGLVHGLLGALVQRLPTASENLIAWMGPGIGRDHYEIGADVRDALRDAYPGWVVERAVYPSPAAGKWSADLYEFARAELSGLGVAGVYGGHFCTYRERRFYSYRRDGVTGRMATLIWLSDGAG
jgi:YfiH family protein